MYALIQNIYTQVGNNDSLQKSRLLQEGILGLQMINEGVWRTVQEGVVKEVVVKLMEQMRLSRPVKNLAKITKNSKAYNPNIHNKWDNWSVQYTKLAALTRASLHGKAFRSPAYPDLNWMKELWTLGMIKIRGDPPMQEAKDYMIIMGMFKVPELALSDLPVCSLNFQPNISYNKHETLYVGYNKKKPANERGIVRRTFNKGVGLCKNGVSSAVKSGMVTGTIASGKWAGKKVENALDWLSHSHYLWFGVVLPFTTLHLSEKYNDNKKITKALKLYTKALKKLFKLTKSLIINPTKWSAKKMWHLKNFSLTMCTLYWLICKYAVSAERIASTIILLTDFITTNPPH